MSTDETRDETVKSALALTGFGLVTAATAALGGVATQRAVKSPWYYFLRKPKFQPPRQAFGPVWTALYALMAGSAWRVWKTPPSPARTRALALWGGQLVLNGAWSWIFFGARKPRAALVEISARPSRRTRTRPARSTPSPRG